MRLEFEQIFALMLIAASLGSLATMPRRSRRAVDRTDPGTAPRRSGPSRRLPQSPAPHN